MRKILLNISSFLSEELDEFTFNGSLDNINSSYDIDGLNLIFPIEYKGKLKNLISGYQLNMQINYKYHTICDRCLKKIVANVEAPFEAYYFKDPTLYDESSSNEYFEINDQAIDLDEIITSIIIMSKPYKVLCKDDCKGLCQFCGTNLNENTCKCSEELNKIDPRFAKLKDLFKNKEV